MAASPDPAAWLERVRAGRASLTEARSAASRCRACPLYANATQTVFGDGPGHARVLLIGEQPGNDEDLRGKPFVGPAGKLLDRALAAAGLERSRLYVTNTVKHFKWTPRGKARIHAKPSPNEIRACKFWLEAEISAVAPEVIVCLGATAAQALIGPKFRVTAQRGELIPSPLAPHLTATVHPSSLLRAPDAASRRRELARFVGDLRRVAKLIAAR